MDELENAHDDYELRRAKVANDLRLLYNATSNIQVRKMLENAIQFVKEKEI